MTDIPSTALTGRALPVSDKEHRRRWLILGVLGLSQLMVVLDATIVNIALPTAQHALHFSNSDRQWVVTGYALAFGSLLLLGGRLADMLGQKRALVVGLVGFAGASALGGFSTSFTMLLAARIIQGAFGALLAPAALSLLTTTFTDGKERNRAFAIYGAIAGAGGAIGLILGGVLTSYVSWRWTLFVNLAIAAVAVPGAIAFLVHRRPADHDPLDIPGVVTVTGGLFAAVYGLSHAETTSWTNPTTLGFLIGGVLLLAAFVLIERMVEYPLLPLRVILNRNRGGSLVALAVTGVGLFGLFLFLTYYLQGTLGYSPVKTGLSFLPMTIALIAVAQLTNVILPKSGPKPLVAVGALLAGAGMLLLNRTGLDSGYLSVVLPALIVMGAGFGLMMSPAINTATLGVDPHDAGVGSATVNTAQQVGGSIGTTLLSTFFASSVSSYAHSHHGAAAHVGALASLHGYHVVFIDAAIALIAGGVVAGLLIRRGPTSAQDTLADTEVSSGDLGSSEADPAGRSLVPVAAGTSAL
jgi:EmrB/QacA subfamily drug resistance transporter